MPPIPGPRALASVRALLVVLAFASPLAACKKAPNHITGEQCNAVKLGSTLAEVNAAVGFEGKPTQFPGAPPDADIHEWSSDREAYPDERGTLSGVFKDGKLASRSCSQF